ncbi:MAG: type II toxin-antitoxin system HicA family toxin [Nitrospirae bacterium]|nr:type II toxin-antitoxin system HicA family toxin [Nitrospirota bacterium]MBF0591527.1 type II toxin-antitoxin system HicA family toxin [Nitrospirota bacterium]
MPRKIRELVRPATVRSEAEILKGSGFYEISGSGKGSHRKLTHARYAGAVTLTGKSGDDAKAYQEKRVKKAIEAVKR